MKKIWHTSNYFLNEPALKLAEKLVSLTFADKVFFSNSAKGVWVYDKKGKDFLDLTGGIAVNCLGHCHAKILKTLEKQAKKIWHTSNYFLNEPALKLAEKLVSLTFADKVFFPILVLKLMNLPSN